MAEVLAWTAGVAGCDLPGSLLCNRVVEFGVAGGGADVLAYGVLCCGDHLGESLTPRLCAHGQI